jgi:hypothetical protein
MEIMRQAWTNERLDDLNLKVDDGFRRVDREFCELRGEMNSRFDSMQRLTLQTSGALLAAIIATQL